MNEKHLSLFQRVEDGLPEVGTKTIVRYTYKGKTEYSMAILDSWSSNVHWNIQNSTTYLNEKPVVTHYLNPDLLTTKKAAIELAEDAWKVGFTTGSYDDVSPSYSSEKDFINQNKKRL